MKKLSRILFCISLLVCFTSAFAGCSNQPVFKPDASALGVWWWDYKLGDEYLEFAADNGVTEIYYSLPVNLLADHARPFILKAKEKNIKVYYLLGDYRWIHNDTAFVAIMEKYAAYQSEAGESEKFAGVHLDVEPHQDPGWKTNRAELLQKYIDFVVRSTAEYGAMDFDIPAWLNDPVVYRGAQTELYKSVITEAGRAFIMSYRDSAENMLNFSTVREQIEFAKSLQKQIFLCAEANAPDEDGTAISYAAKGKAVMYEELNKLKGLTGYEALGISIHHIQSWYEMKE